MVIYRSLRWSCARRMHRLRDDAGAKKSDEATTGTNYLTRGLSFGKWFPNVGRVQLWSGSPPPLASPRSRQSPSPSVSALRASIAGAQGIPHGCSLAVRQIGFDCRCSPDKLPCRRDRNLQQWTSRDQGRFPMQPRLKPRRGREAGDCDLRCNFPTTYLAPVRAVVVKTQV